MVLSLSQGKISKEEVIKYVHMPHRIHIAKDKNVEVQGLDVIYAMNIPELSAEVAVMEHSISATYEALMEVKESWITWKLEQGEEIPVAKDSSQLFEIIPMF